MEALCGFSKMKENDDLIGDQAGAIRGKWRIVDRKEDELYDLKFRVPRW
jgi:hypothetical protein